MHRATENVSSGDIRLKLLLRLEGGRRNGAENQIEAETGSEICPEAPGS